MISVLVNETDRPAVTEFFELFKTPWQFHAPGSPADVLLCAGDQVPVDDARLLLVFSGVAMAADQTAIQPESGAASGWFRHDAFQIPIYCRQCVDKSSRQIVFQRQSVNGRPCIRIGFDLFAEVRYLLAQGQPEANAAVPALEHHIGFLRELLLSHGLPVLEIPPRPAGHDFIACLTHDVDHVAIRNYPWDHTMLGFLCRATVGSAVDVCRGKKAPGQLCQNLLAALKLPLVHLGLARDFWVQFDRYVALEAGRPSTFFVIPKKGETGLDARGRRPALRAAGYSAANLGDSWRQLEQAGKEVAVHGLDAWRDAAAGREERACIDAVVQQEPAGVRMHWLYFDAAAPAKLETAGFLYDSTAGYNGTVGYWAGTTQVFRPLAAQNLLELPLHIMDTALFFPSHLDLSARQAESCLRPLLVNASFFGGVLTTNWHDRSLAPERLWGATYEWLLGALREKNVWFATASQTVAWFRHRRAARFEMLSGNRVRIHLPAGADDRLPALRAELHRPRRPAAEEIIRDGSEISLPG